MEFTSCRAHIELLIVVTRDNNDFQTQTAGSALTCAGGLVTLGGEGGGQGGGGGVGRGAGGLARVLQAALQGVHVGLQRDHRPVTCQGCYEMLGEK